MATAFVVIAGLGITNAAAHAGSTGSYVNAFPPERGPGSLNIQGGSEANDIRVRIKDGEYRIRDRAGITAGEHCQNLTDELAQCMRWEQDHFAALLGPGNDDFILDVPGRYGQIRGGQGNDLIKSGNARNTILGQGGADDLRGRRGNDSLHGGAGRDRLLGGRGNDRLDAADDDRDRVIDCGPGDDIAVIDRPLDPNPKGCEEIIYR